jgi:tetratricopeptide (TPR) repeat protein
MIAGPAGPSAPRRARRRSILDGPENAPIYWRAFISKMSSQGVCVMRKLLSGPGTVALVAALAVALTGCAQVGALKARMALRDAVKFYQRQDYKQAAQKYEEALQADPSLGDAYFYLGNSYDNLYKPSRKGEADNDELLQKAIVNYKKASEQAQTPITRQRAMQFLVAVYGAEKLNDPSQQEPILRKMIEMDPTDPGNYYYLANVHEQSGNYEEAEKLLLKAREMKPNDPTVYTTLAGFYNRQGQFDKTMEALNARAQKEPNNPEAFYMISTFYWEKAQKDFTISQAERMKFAKLGIQAVDKALELKQDYLDALVYKGLLLRVEALLEKDPKVQQQLIKEAVTYQERAKQVQSKQRAAGAE